jgi:hypothetical protein
MRTRVIRASEMTKCQKTNTGRPMLSTPEG